MARGRRILLVNTAAINNQRWSAEQLTKFMQTGNLGKAKSDKPKAEPYDQGKLKRLLGL